MASHLEEDFTLTLALVRKLRLIVVAEPIVYGKLHPTAKTMTDIPNPASKLLANAELHLRGLARLLGPASKEKDMGREFRDAAKLGNQLVAIVTEDVQSQAIAILRSTQTHVRGCAQILAIARATVPPEGDEEGYGELFREPGLVKTDD